jgi:hypothetical protein
MSRLVFFADDLASLLAGAVRQKVEKVTITSTRGDVKRPGGAVEFLFPDGDRPKIKASAVKIDEVEEAFRHEVPPQQLLDGFGGALKPDGVCQIKVFVMSVELSPYGVKVDPPRDHVTGELR